MSIVKLLCKFKLCNLFEDSYNKVDDVKYTYKQGSK
jgi:hypothetical protein